VKGAAMQEPEKKDKTVLFFDVCANIEGLCAKLYHYYSDIHRDNEDVSRLWKKTALEEENHQKQFEFAQRILDDVEFDLVGDFEKTCRIQQKLNNLLDHVQQNPPDMETALSRAIEMEEILSELHLDTSVKFHDASIRDMFLAFRDFDQDHVKSLRHCLSILTLSKSEMVG
jgi:rubrerythrin